MAGMIAPREIISGRESIEQLSHLRGKRAMVITSGEKMEQRGFLSRALDALKRTGMQTEHHRAEDEKTAELCAQTGAATMRAFLPDWIVALGSESVSMAKLMWIFYEYPEATLLDLQIPESIPLLRRKARFAVMPGLDQTVEAVAAVAAIGGTENRAAWSVCDSGLVPDVVFLDPEMICAESAACVAETAASVFAGAVDAFSGREHDPFTAPQAAEAVRLSFTYAQKAMNGEGDACSALQHAQTLAGIAFSNVRHAPSAAFARQTAGRLAGAHERQGMLALSFLPHIIRHFAENEKYAERFASVAAVLGIKGKTPLQTALNLAKTAEQFYADLGFSGMLKELGIEEGCFEAHFDVIASRAAGDLYAGSGFQTMTQSAAKRILQDVMKGQKA